jgi:hypothetical protein
MADRREFSYLQMAVAGLVGSPLAAGALVAWNLTHQSAHLAAWFMTLFVVMVAATDTLVGMVGSRPLGVATFVLLILLPIGIGYLMRRRDEEERPPYGWVVMLPIVVCSLVLAFLMRALTDRLVLGS